MKATEGDARGSGGRAARRLRAAAPGLGRLSRMSARERDRTSPKQGRDDAAGRAGFAGPKVATPSRARVGACLGGLRTDSF